MADWQDRRELYLEAGRLGAQRHEDMLAGRVLRGLGYKNPTKTIYHVERAVLGETRGSLPLWQRARELVTILWNRTAYADLLRVAAVDAAEVKDTAEAYERVSQVDWQGAGVRPVLFTRLKGTTKCHVYTFWTRDELNLIAPFFAVHPCEEHPHWLFTQQEAAHFVEQFGPYDISPTEQELCR